MSTTKSQLKQMIEEQLEGLVNEQSYAQQGFTADQINQARDILNRNYERDVPQAQTVTLPDGTEAHDPASARRSTNVDAAHWLQHGRPIPPAARQGHSTMTSDWNKDKGSEVRSTYAMRGTPEHHLTLPQQLASQHHIKRDNLSRRMQGSQTEDGELVKDYGSENLSFDTRVNRVPLGTEDSEARATAELEMVPWRGQTSVIRTSPEGEVEETGTTFIQPADTRYGQLGTKRQVTESQLKQIIEEQLEGLVSEQSSAQQGKAYQAKSDAYNVTNKSGARGRETFMSRGDPSDVNKGAPIEVSSDVQRKASNDGEILSSMSNQATPGAGTELEFEPWRGQTRDVDTESGQDVIHQFIQPANTRYGQLDPTRQVTESQLKQMIEEQLEGLVSEQSYAQQGSKAYQAKDYQSLHRKPGKDTVETQTFMHRGDDSDVNKGAQPIHVDSVTDDSADSKGREDVTIRSKQSTPDAAAKLEFEPWKGETFTITTDPTTGKTKEFGSQFIQPADTRYGQLDPTRQVTESQLKQMIEEEYQALLKESNGLSFEETIRLEQFKDYIDTFSIGPNSTPESLANHLGQRMKEEPHLSDTIMMHLKAAARGVKGYEKESQIAREAAMLLGIDLGQDLLSEKAKSKSQQRFMGMVRKCQETGDCASEEVRKAAKSMKKKDASKFAKTKHKGLPEKKKKKVNEQAYSLSGETPMQTCWDGSIRPQGECPPRPPELPPTRPKRPVRKPPPEEKEKVVAPAEPTPWQPDPEIDYVAHMTKKSKKKKEKTSSVHQQVQKKIAFEKRAEQEKISNVKGKIMIQLAYEKELQRIEQALKNR